MIVFLFNFKGEKVQMSVEVWTYIIVGITFAIYLYIGYSNRVREGLPPTVQEVVFINYAHRMFNLMETTFLHHREGSLGDDVFKGRVSGFGAVMRTQPGLVVVWDEAGGKELGYTAEFREFMQNDIIGSEGADHLAKA